MNLQINFDLIAWKSWRAEELKQMKYYIKRLRLPVLEMIKWSQPIVKHIVFEWLPPLFHLHKEWTEIFGSLFLIQ